MKLLLRSIILLAFCFINGYGAHAVPVRSNEKCAVSFALTGQQASAYRLQQTGFHSGHLPATPRKLFRKTRATKEDDDDESKFSCLKKARDGDADLQLVACSFPYNTIPPDAPPSQLISLNHTVYNSLPSCFLHKRYRLFCVFRI